MIVTHSLDGSVLVTQADHARLASEMLSLVRLPELVGHPRRELLLRAVREHDNGWWEADSAPRLAASGTTARDFRDFPAELRQEIWRRGVERFAADDPYLAARLAAHCLRLLRRFGDEPSWAEFRTELAARQGELLAAAGEGFDIVADDDRWMALADGLSLAACTGDSTLVDHPGWRAELGLRGAGETAGETIDLCLAPFPFAGATSFWLPCRRLEERRYPSAAALGAALISTPWRRLRVRLLPR
jgi:hypothetical protein